VAQENGRRPSHEELPDILSRWIEEDRKHPGLKAIQGMIWHEGYRAGAFAPGLYDDVVPALNRWRGNGLQLALYSSGSEQAQRLLVGHTTDGDLTDLFSNFFDTSIGAKTETASYRRIGQILALSSKDILFLSDIEAELDAAAEAGFNTTQIVRAGTNAGTAHPVCSNFGDIAHFKRSEPLPCSSERT
jgi:enolase-phosphatase E1